MALIINYFFLKEAKKEQKEGERKPKKKGWGQREKNTERRTIKNSSQACKKLQPIYFQENCYSLTPTTV